MINAGLSVEIRTAESDAAIKIVTLVGVLDTISAPKAEEVIDPALEQDEQNGGCLIIDCSKLAYMNSDGLALLMRYHVQKRRRNGSFKIVAPAACVKEIIEVSGAIKMLEIYKSEQEAVISWRRK
ncbi:MAG: STAS domain-containing protein [Elusimicrobia bacterium]|nr:STAS domain-containing protein [Elusimicrobiota bacterium]